MKFEAEFNADQSLLIQPHGAIFAVDQRTERLLFASQNANDFVACERIGDLVDQPVYDWLGRDVTHALRNVESQPSLHTRRQHMGRHSLAGRACDLTAFASQGHLVVEAIPTAFESEPTAYDVLKDVEVLTDALVSASGPRNRFDRFVALLRTMSGYHCVAMEQGLGSDFETVATAGRSELGTVHCASSHQLHVLKDATAPGVTLSVPANFELPDMRLSALRFPSVDQLRAMRRAGIAACATIGISCGTRRWGYLKFVHATPRCPNKRTQLSLAHLAPLVGQVLQSAR